jgi:Flp pilus assembly pilin Flp
MVYNRQRTLYHLDRRSRVIPSLSREEGQGLIEYALIIVLVAIIVIAILLLLSDVIPEWLNRFMDFIS